MGNLRWPGYPGLSFCYFFWCFLLCTSRWRETVPEQSRRAAYNSALPDGFCLAISARR
jgi:hypothetical protein